MKDPWDMEVAVTLTFEEFWTWVQQHYNCVLRVGTPDAVIFDQETFHWRFLMLEADLWLVQLAQGKNTVAEMAVIPSKVTYVQALPGEADDVLFEMISETDQGRDVVNHFVLSHGYDGDPEEGTLWVN